MSSQRMISQTKVRALDFDNEWYDQAACKNSPLSFIEDRPATLAHRLTCAGCPVIEPCRQVGLEFPYLPGIYGGLDQSDRYGTGPRVRTCRSCGLRKPVQSFRGQARTCRVCQEDVFEELRRCRHCDRLFRPTHTHQFICSSVCRNRREYGQREAYRKRKSLGLPIRPYGSAG